MKVAIALVLIVLIALLVWRLGSRSIFESTAVHSVATPEEAAADQRPVIQSWVEQGVKSLSPAPIDVHEIGTEGSDRQLIDVALSGRVSSTGGRALAGAALKWSCLKRPDTEWEPAWHGSDWGVLDRSARSTVSDVHGSFSFTSAPGVVIDGASVLLISFPRHKSKCVLVREGVRDLGIIRLEESVAPLVRVLDFDGLPVAGALIEQFGTTPPETPNDSLVERDPRRLWRHLYHRAHTDASGEVEVSAFPGVQVLQASLGPLRSVPWKGEAQEVVTLKLLETFSVGGEVTLPDWSHLNYEGERRIVLSAKVGTTKRILASIREVEAGSWGPIDVPRIQGATYEARLEGSPIIPISLELAPPPAGGHARIDFHAEIGHDVWIAGVDESGELLPNTEGTVWWVEDGVTRSLTRRCYPESDLINLWSVPAGPVHYMVRAPGYVPSFGGPLVVPQPPEGSYAVTLRRGGALAGRCIYEGEPLSDFDVFVWRGHAEVRAHRFPFRDRRDGRFEIEAAPLGDVWVSATSGRLPACAPRQVHIEGDETAEVVLDLEEGHDGRGEVVDAADGTPVETARIQRFLMAGQQAHDRWGDRVPVQGDGSFVVTDLSSGYNLIEVSAPGYANLLVGGRVGPDGVADFGTLLLSRSQSFEVRLLSANLEEDFTLYEAFGAEPTTLEAKRFDRDGVVRYENVGPGDHHLRIHREGAMASTTTFHLQPGEPWSFIRMLSGARRLSIEVVPSDEVPLSEVGAYYVRYVNSAGLEVTLDRYFPEDGHIRLDEIDADEVNVIVADKAYRTIASKRASYGDTDELSMRIYLGEEPLRVRLVDAAGTPLSGVLVAATSNLTSRFEAASRTGAGGVAELTGVPTHPFLIAAHHNEYGTLRTEYGGGVGEVTYVLRNDGSVRIRVLDGRTPIAGAQGTIRDALGGRITGIRTTDATGSVHWLNLTPGTYPVRFEHPDAWPVTVELTAAVEGPHAEVQMRRLGDLVVEVSNADGLPVPGATLDLEHAELQESVALWLEAGRVEGSPPMTDPTGHWRVARIPRGIYRWRATGPSGATGEGTLEVLPGVETPVEVRLTVP